MFSNLFFRLLVNGVQAGDSVNAKLDNTNSDVPIQITTIADMEIGDVITAELVRDSGGGNSGQLVTLTPILGGWASSPSAIIRINL